MTLLVLNRSTTHLFSGEKIGRRDYDITEIDITESDVTETDIMESDITESDITESDITSKRKLI